MRTNSLNARLPGEELVLQGLADLQAGLRTVPACLVKVARGRLSRAGLISSAAPSANTDVDAERQLYRLLLEEGGDAYSRYNALVRELVSFENALEIKNRKA